MAPRRGKNPATHDVIDGVDPTPVPEAVRKAVEELGLSPYESRVLLGLFRLGSANSIQLAKVSGVPRTAVYPVLEGLGAKGLAVRLPVEGPAQWASPGRDEVLEQLDAALVAASDQRLREHRARAAQVRELLKETFPETPSVALPFVHQLHGAGRVRSVYDALLTGAETEVLMFTRPPFAYTSGPANVNQAVLAMLGRGIPTRVLYQQEQIDDPGTAGFRAEMEAYHDAGVEARVVEELPIKVVVVDRRAVLLGMADPVAPEAGYPTTLLIEHPGCARVQALAFEQLWADGVPYDEALGRARRERRARA